MTPIKTRIKNVTDSTVYLPWLPNRTFSVPAGGSITLDFEPWSAWFTPARQESFIRFCNSGLITLSLLIVGAGGKYTEVEYCPQEVIKAREEEQKQQRTKQATIVSMDTTKQKVAELDHTVKIISTDTANILESMGAKKVGFEDEIVPVREVKNGEPEQPKEEPKQEEPTVEKEVPAEQPTKKTRSKKS